MSKEGLQQTPKLEGGWGGCWSAHNMTALAGTSCWPGEEEVKPPGGARGLLYPQYWLGGAGQYDGRRPPCLLLPQFLAANWARRQGSCSQKQRQWLMSPAGLEGRSPQPTAQCPQPPNPQHASHGG